MAIQSRRPPGRPKNKEIADVRKEILFRPSEWAVVETKLSLMVAKEELDPNYRPATFFHDLLLDWAKNRIVDRDELLANEGVGDFSAPHLQSVPMGPFREAVEEASDFVISEQTQQYLGAQEGDFWLDGHGQSMEGASIPDGARLLFRPLPANTLPRRGQIVLVEIKEENEAPRYTVKRIFRPSPLAIEDGAGELIEFPDNLERVAAIATLISYMAIV